VTREGQLKGKLPYMAPEQVGGGTVDRRSDVFGASVVFWEMLTGVRLFDGADEGEIYGKVVRTEVRRPSQVVQGVDRKTDAIVLRGLARSQGKRYESARAMALAIETALPLAPPSQVGQWVERLTGDAIAERRRQIAELEGETEGGEGGTAIRAVRRQDPAANIATSPGGRSQLEEGSALSTRPGTGSPSPEAMFTDTSLVASEPQSVRRPARRSPVVGVAGVALVAVATAMGVALLRRAPAAIPSAASATATTTAASAAVVPPSPSTAPSPAPTVAASTTPEVSPTDLPVAPPLGHPPLPRSVVPRRSPASSSCDPPYTIDANGYKKYKRECASW
jgi:serine/threonine-protein kinase